ncbi:DUF4381 domain-containing protein [Oceanicella sp. SM1341]|uniref:DUF4381 domain-containing protein n=1 Tax=Oceanicella sp. SM1341 TaxID=1548889 RepID=UPI000E4E1585|nr:DUF4381 domain-containing protein [Oceanicella sp. SM1341]
MEPAAAQETTQETAQGEGGTTLVDLLDQLVPPAEPPPVSLMPQTWGWVALAVLLALLLALAARALWRRHRANAWRRAALRLLAEAGDDPARISAILRRAALTCHPRAEVAGLTGAAWLGFLDAHGGGGAFTSGPGRALATAPYSGAGPDPALTRAAIAWVRRHRPERRR